MTYSVVPPRQPRTAKRTNAAEPSVRMPSGLKALSRALWRLREREMYRDTALYITAPPVYSAGSSLYGWSLRSAATDPYNHPSPTIPRMQKPAAGPLQKSRSISPRRP
ncbi:hypothetical protein MRX96_047737 [Rhipicephalus microplus]